MTTFNAGDMVRLNRDSGVPLLGTVIDGPTTTGYVHLEWAADADGGPYEDECEAGRLTLVDPIDAHYLRLAAEVDAICGGAVKFQASLIDRLWGDVTVEVEGWYGDQDDMTGEEKIACVREGMIENLLDDMACELHPHGYYLDRDDAGHHVLIQAGL